MTTAEKFVAFCLVAFGTTMLVRHGAMALHPARPADMPANAFFAQSGYNLDRNEPTGEWIACVLKYDASADFCRVTDPKGTVIYEGEFLPSDGSPALPTGQIRVATQETQDTWIDGPAEDGPIPVIPLVNGKILVPSDDTYALTYRWNQNPDELKRIQGSGV
jgi:hypothetical protein